MNQLMSTIIIKKFKGLEVKVEGKATAFSVSRHSKLLRVLEDVEQNLKILDNKFVNNILVLNIRITIN